MSKTSDVLFEYLRDIIYNPSKAELAVEKLDEDFVMLGKGLMYFAQCLSQSNEFAMALSRGDLGTPLPPRENELAAPLKSLCASLKHLTWQSQQVAKGDYSQRVDFMGEFSHAFNTMIEQLADRQQRLEDKIRRIQKKTKALEQSNLLLTVLMHHVPQQIIIMERDSHNIMLMNDIATLEANHDEQYVTNLMQIMPSRNESGNRHNIEIQYTDGEQERYLIVKSYMLEWNNANAEIFIITDISNVKNTMKKLEVDAYQDSLTHLYNRLFGMLTLDSWLHEKKHFSLVFADLDCLKYINDEYGHHEGDRYITTAANYLKIFSTDAIICRLGGDEFMLLVPDIEYDEVQATMEKVYQHLQNDAYLEGKEYSYSISFGIVTVTRDNTLSAGDILSAADEKMYQHKRMRKKFRRADRYDD